MRGLILAVTAASMALPVAMPEPAMARDGYYSGRVWRDSQGRMRCRRPNGTTGLIVGAAGGALRGRALDTQGSRATGTIVGAAAGALVGREIERKHTGYRCR